MTTDEIIRAVEFAIQLFERVKAAAQSAPPGADMDLNSLIVKSVTQKEQEAGIDQADVQQEIEKINAGN